MAIGTTIDGLNTVTSLTTNDEVPVWDAEASGEPTKKITAQNMAASVKSLADLPNTTEMNTAIQQSTAVKRITVTGTPNQYGSLAYTDELEAVADRITGIVSVTNGGRVNVTTFWQSPKHYFACYDIYNRAAYTSKLSITVSYI